MAISSSYYYDPWKEEFLIAKRREECYDLSKKQVNTVVTDESKQKDTKKELNQTLLLLGN